MEILICIVKMENSLQLFVFEKKSDNACTFKYYPHICSAKQYGDLIAPKSNG